MGDKTAFEVGQIWVQVKRIADILTAPTHDIFIGLPGLVGYWPMGVRAASSVTDHTGNGFTLTQTGTCPTGYDGNSYAHLGDGTNYVWNSSAQLGLSGLETWIDASIRGLTYGAWFFIEALPSNNGGLITKTGAVTDYGYALFVNLSGTISTWVSSNGSVLSSVQSAVTSTGAWHFIVSRFTPSTEVAVFVDGVKVANTTAIPASIYVSSQAFEIGRYLAIDGRTAHARVRDAFICAAALPDSLIEEIRTTSAP